jgi:hypothetical protein
MGLRYEDLTPETRRFMLEEIQRDDLAETLYRSPWLTQGGQGDWAEILREAATNGTHDTLAAQLRLRGRIVARAQRRKPNSPQMTWYAIGPHAPDVMACEFNVFYCRGLCRRAIAENIPRLEVYRARVSARPRHESEMKLGLLVEPEVILIDLRSSHGTEPSFGLPPGPNIRQAAWNVFG